MMTFLHNSDDIELILLSDQLFSVQ